MTRRDEGYAREYERLRDRFADAYLSWQDAQRRKDVPAYDAAVAAVVAAQRALDAHVLGKERE